MANYPAIIGDFFICFSCKNETLTHYLQTHFIPYISPPHKAPHLRVLIEDNYGVPFNNYEVSVTKEHNKILYKRADYIIEVDHSLGQAKVSVNNELALKHALMNLFSAFINYHNWGLLIHSSCVIETNAAHLFAGRSGAGKSTVALLSNPRNLLSDEATLLKIDKSRVTVFDSPFRSELKPIYIQSSYPLKSIQLLNQALHNERVSITQANALFNLIDKVFYWPQNTEETKRIIQMLKILVNHVPTYELYFLKNNTFWELIS